LIDLSSIKQYPKNSKNKYQYQLFISLSSILNYIYIYKLIYF
jgi:hypothetical protein